MVSTLEGVKEKPLAWGTASIFDWRDGHGYGTRCDEYRIFCDELIAVKQTIKC